MTAKQFLVLGHPQDVHSIHVKNALRDTGATVKIIETHRLPSQLALSWHADTQSGAIAFESGCVWNLADIHGIFWRQISGVRIPDIRDEQQKRCAYNDSMSLLRTILRAHPDRVVNSWEAYQFHKEKPRQLSAVKQLGILIPKTLVTNDPKQVRAFVRSQEKTIFKPVYGGAHSQFVTEDHLESERLSLALQLSPVTLQEYVPGTNIRSYAIGESVFSAEIRSPSLDFRNDRSAALIPIDLPHSVQAQCLTISKALKLKWTAIDWRLTPSGEYVFLEANPSPMFVHFERETGYPITSRIVSLLVGE